MFFVQTFTLIPRMHPKLTEYEMSCMQNNQLLTKTLVELRDYIPCILIDKLRETTHRLPLQHPSGPEPTRGLFVVADPCPI